MKGAQRLHTLHRKWLYRWVYWWRLVQSSYKINQLSAFYLGCWVCSQYSNEVQYSQRFLGYLFDLSERSPPRQVLRHTVHFTILKLYMHGTSSTWESLITCNNRRGCLWSLSLASLPFCTREVKIRPQITIFANHGGHMIIFVPWESASLWFEVIYVFKGDLLCCFAFLSVFYISWTW